MEILFLVVVGIVTAVLSLAGGILLIVGKRTARFLQKNGPIIAAVVILSTVFGDILPEILEDGKLSILQTLVWMAVGTVICFFVGFLLSHIHKHGDKRDLHNKKQAYGMLIVDSLHALADGVVLGAAFAANPMTGILTAVSTVAHEIPQEIGDFAIMLRSNIRKRDVVILQMLSSLFLVPAAIASYFLSDVLEPHLPMVLALVAGFLLYIALGEIWVVTQDYRGRKEEQKKSKKHTSRK